MNGAGRRYRQTLKQGEILDRALAISILVDGPRLTALGEVSSARGGDADI